MGEPADYKNVVIDLLQTIWSCSRQNTNEWMEYMTEKMDAAAIAIGRTERWQYDKRHGSIRVIPETRQND